VYLSGAPSVPEERTECDLGALRLINVSARQLRERRSSEHLGQG
jgi:hypothetical protein